MFFYDHIAYYNIIGVSKNNFEMAAMPFPVMALCFVVLISNIGEAGSRLEVRRQGKYQSLVT